MSKAEERANGNYRNKFLKIFWLLKAKSDKDNMLTTYDIIDELKKVGVAIDRRTLSREIELMNEAGINIVKKYKGHMYAYYMEKDSLTIEELNLLVNAVYASTFITEEDSKKIIAKLFKQGEGHKLNVPDTKLVCYNIHKETNNELFKNLLILQNCITEKKEATFYYFDIDHNGEKVYRKNKKLYTVCPVTLVFSEGFYYLVCYNPKYKSINNYRVDRCENLEMGMNKINHELALEFLKEYLPQVKGVRKEADLEESLKTFVNQSFKMYGGAPNNVSLEFPEELIGPVYDKFGINKATFNAETGKCTVSVRVQTGPTFWSWVAMFEGKMKITGPNKCAKEYKAFCEKLVESVK